MTERVKTLLNWIVEGEHKALRAPLDEENAGGHPRADTARGHASEQACRAQAQAASGKRARLCARDERIPGIRTIPEFPDIYAEGEKECIFAGHFIHEQGRVCNISSDYEGVLREGLLPRRARAEQTLARGAATGTFSRPPSRRSTRVIAFADRYAEALPDGEG